MYQFRGAIYTVASTVGNRVAIEPVPNTELETVYVDIDIFYKEAKPLPQHDVSKKTSRPSEAGEDQPKITRKSSQDQPEIKLRSTGDQAEISVRSFFSQLFSGEKNEKSENSENTVKKGGVSPRSLEALGKARSMIAKNPYDVMCEYWQVIRWLDTHYGLEKLEQQPSFPRRLRQKANENLGLQKSLGFYYNLVRYYGSYKKMIPVPIWVIKLEYWFENKIFNHLQD